MWRNFVLALHVHRFLEMHLIVGGSAVVVLSDQRLLVPTGTLLWMPPGGKGGMLLLGCGDGKTRIARKRQSPTMALRRAKPRRSPFTIAARSGAHELSGRAKSISQETLARTTYVLEVAPQTQRRARRCEAA